MTYGTSITKLENENNYQKILKSVMKTFNDTTFDFNGITKKLKPIFFISDNAMMQSAFQLKKCYSNKSKNSCKACTINGEDFHLYTKKKALETFLRESYHSYFPRNNHFIFDTFHDLQEGICAYILYLCVHLFKKLFNMEGECLREKILKKAQKLRLHSQLKTPLKEKFFELFSKKDILENKGRFSLNGQQTFYLMICFYHIVKESFIYCDSVILYEKIQKIFEVLHYTISMVVFFSNKKEVQNIENPVDFIEKIVENHFESLFSLTDNKFRMTLKYHNLCHYGKMIETFPYVSLSAFSTLRFESSNSRIKKLLNVGSSYVNPCKTIIQKIAWNNFLDRNITKEGNEENEESEDVEIEWDFTITHFDRNPSLSLEGSENVYEEFNALNETLTNSISNDN
uniref:Dimer_Tnp_hAT domain-containing protein n=1 Tax=Strongyloides venezuelensis TaxID=75913 RepID=A0A0K0FRJ9_STRVS